MGLNTRYVNGRNSGVEDQCGRLTSVLTHLGDAELGVTATSNSRLFAYEFGAGPRAELTRSRHRTGRSLGSEPRLTRAEADMGLQQPDHHQRHHWSPLVYLRQRVLKRVIEPLKAP